MAYLYRHIRLDKNEPFYIGIGSDSEGKYIRAHASWGHNKIWENIVNKTEYKVDIMLDDISYDEACEKEKFFIKYYGRKIYNNGPLCNITDGGDGVVGYKRSAQLNEDALWYKAIPIHQYDLEGNYIRSWRSIKEASRELGISNTSITMVLKGRKNMAKKFMFTYEKVDKLPKCSSPKFKPVYQYSKEGQFIKKWDSTMEAEIFTGKIGVYSCLIGKTKTCGGFRWSKQFKNNLDE